MASKIFVSTLALLTVQAVRAVPAATPVSSTSVPLPTVYGKLSKGGQLMDERPQMPFDPNTNPDCAWWWDNDGSISCQNMPAEWGISLENFLAWNPSITPDCSNFNTGFSYCVEAPSAAPPPSSTTEEPGSPTETGNGIETPLPTQPGMVDDCDTFYFVKQGDGCAVIAADHGISLQDFISWNPTVESGCTGLWANVNVCVGVLGSQPSSSTTRASTTTSAGNGVETPQPTQPNLVSNCNSFYFVESGDGCAAIAADHGITLAQFLAWNPSAGSNCAGLWANAYACVGIIGGSPPPSTTVRTSTTTSAGNGISTPVPTQPGIVANCDRFHLVKSGDTCATIGAQYTVTAQRIQQWNGLTSACSGLWADAYVCVRTIGYTSTVSLSCASSGKTWGGNEASALTRARDWCDGNSNTDGNGAYSLAQTKTGCYNAPNGNNKIQFTARNDLGASAYLSIARCESLIRRQISGCARGGTGTQEGWWFR